MSKQTQAAHAEQVKITALALPAPLEARHAGNGGVGWPWAQYRDPDAPELPEPVAADAPAAALEVVRPVPLYVNGKRVTAATEAATGDARGKLLRAPGGELVRFTDLRRFCEQAGAVGPAFAVWRQRGWKLPYWCAVVDILALYGIVTTRQQRVPTRMLVQPADALARIAEAVA